MAEPVDLDVQAMAGAHAALATIPWERRDAALVWLRHRTEADILAEMNEAYPELSVSGTENT